MLDFTTGVYERIIIALRKGGYTFQPVKDFIHNPCESVIVLRHDVDKLPMNSLDLAEILYNLNVKASFYFRLVPQSFDRDIIEKIAKMGHEIGYHYEDFDLTNGDFEAAIELFERNLTKLRDIYPVTTICMHGSPRSQYDNRDLWNKYDYRNFGIIAEPYFDINFSKVLYLTDTGRKWNGASVSIRDKVQISSHPSKLISPNTIKGSFVHSSDIIRAAESGNLPDQVMITFHPQRWTNSPFAWLKELFWQDIKNIVKYWLNKTGRSKV